MKSPAFGASCLALSLLLTSEAFAPTTPRRLRPDLSLFSAAPATTDVECLVIGGGISGSTLAHNLNRAGVDLLLTETRDYLGGNVKSRKQDGFVWEEGPNSFATQPSIVRISHELGIEDQLVFADESLPPWVNHNGKLHPLPKGKGGKGPKGQLELVFGSNGVLKFGLLGELLSIPGTIRAGIGAFLGHAKAPEGKEETIREWVTRTLGEEVFLRCIDPFVSGVYAGDPQTLSMKAALGKIARIENYAYDIEWNKFGAIFYGGLARQVELTKERKADPPDPSWVEFEYGNPGSYKEGLATLPNAISEGLGQPVGVTELVEGSKVRLQWKIKSLETVEGGGYVATFETPEGVRTVNAKSVVSTAPAHALAEVIRPVLPKASEILEADRAARNQKGIYHPPVYAVTVAYPKSAFRDVELANSFGPLRDLPGFGMLNPRSEGVRTLGTLWSSSLFPGRAPPDYNLLLNYIGGSRDVGIAELTESEVVSEVDKGCRTTLLKPDAPPPKLLGAKLWPTAIPQYEIGHLDLMERLEKEEKTAPGLWICGNYRSGVAFPDCVTFGYEHAKVVKEFLTKLK
ncbi:hypothetical protein TrVE_jg466 [Triparma verrucosa]|uniref:Protoporphyrinogen oxidase n=1 Tax=Triparma verrucosa TaxID=1606542 RepID=A0A9W7C631_9STRA|nr:hypothetical protein TrVE_jg466 [Triparma verrucosa]